MSILGCPMQQNDANAETIRDYLIELLLAVWREGQEFSGKRPFGDSGWEYEIYKALGNAGLIECTFDEDGYIDRVDSATADRLVADAIRGFRSHDQLREGLRRLKNQDYDMGYTAETYAEAILDGAEPTGESTIDG